MRYEKTFTFSGNPAEAIDVAKSSFLPNGFQITELTDNSIVVENKSYVFLQQQGNPFVGASTVDIRIDNSTIYLSAELKNISRIMLAVLFILLGTAAVLAAVFAIVLRGQDARVALLVIPLAFTPWPVLLPLIYWFLRARTCKSLDILVVNMAAKSVLKS